MTLDNPRYHLQTHCFFAITVCCAQSTIAPLTAEDRRIIQETQKNWMLSDLDVQGKLDSHTREK